VTSIEALIADGKETDAVAHIVKVWCYVTLQYVIYVR
jgi:hypothetical protein